MEERAINFFKHLGPEKFMPTIVGGLVTKMQIRVRHKFFQLPPLGGEKPEGKNQS